MENQDILVGCVSITLGLFCVVAAILNWEWSFRLRKLEWLDNRYGRGFARLAYAGVGAVMIALGGAIFAGSGWHWLPS